MNDFRKDDQINPNIQSWQNHSSDQQTPVSQNLPGSSDAGSQYHSGSNDTGQRSSGNANYQNNQSYSANPYYTGNQQYSGNQQQPNPYYSYYSEKKQPEVDELKTSSFYSERYEKPHKGKMREMIVPLLIVALLSSVLGGALVAHGSSSVPRIWPVQHKPGRTTLA